MGIPKWLHLRWLRNKKPIVIHFSRCGRSNHRLEVLHRRTAATHPQSEIGAHLFCLSFLLAVPTCLSVEIRSYAGTPGGLKWNRSLFGFRSIFPLGNHGTPPVVVVIVTSFPPSAMCFFHFRSMMS